MVLTKNQNTNTLKLKGNKMSEENTVAVANPDENVQEVELTEEQLAHQETLKQVMAERQRIAGKINGQKVSDAFITIIQRAEMHSMVHGVDYFVTTVENGIAFFNETDYDKLVEKTLADLRLYLAKQGVEGEAAENEVDAYAANLVIHYVDFKSFTDEEVQATRSRFAPAPAAEAAPEAGE